MVYLTPLDIDFEAVMASHPGPFSSKLQVHPICPI